MRSALMLIAALAVVLVLLTVTAWLIGSLAGVGIRAARKVVAFEWPEFQMPRWLRSPRLTTTILGEPYRWNDDARMWERDGPR